MCHKRRWTAHLAAAEVDWLVALGRPGAHDVQSVRASLEVVFVGQVLCNGCPDSQPIQSSHCHHLDVPDSKSACSASPTTGTLYSAVKAPCVIIVHDDCWHHA